MNYFYSLILFIFIYQVNQAQVESDFLNDSVNYEESTPRNSSRMLILVTLEDQHPQLTKQVDIINAHRKEAIERKISIIQATPNGVKPIFNSNKNMSRVGMSFRQMKRGDSDFELILVGMDGTIKLRRKLAIEADELFAIIDEMPMRQSEIGNE